MEDILKQILEGQKQLVEEQRTLLARVDKIDNNLSQLSEKVDTIKEQQAENTLLIGVLMHRTEELDAKFDGFAA